MAEIPDQLLKKVHACRSLPSIPNVVLEVLELCRSERTGTAELSQVISRDPALAAKVLKVANSAYYGSRGEVTEFDRAVSLIGINGTMSLALGFSIVHATRTSPIGSFDHVAYWRRSAIVAAAAGAIGKTVSSPLPASEYFLAGLLQDIGMLVLNQVIPKQYQAIVSHSDARHDRLVQNERNELDTDHGTIGAWLLDHWNLPKHLSLLVRGSHDPEGAAEDPQLMESIRACALASDIAEIWCSLDPGSALAAARTSAEAIFPDSPGKFDELLQTIANEIPKVTINLDIEFDDPDQIHGLLDEAREALIHLNLNLAKNAEETQRRAERDPLTQIANRSSFDIAIADEFKKAQDEAKPLSVLFVDIDHFKRVNDTYGHLAGDAVLTWLGTMLKSGFRATDFVARYGGEEFVVILPGAPADVAFATAERFRERVATQMCQMKEPCDLSITVSIGCATMTAETPYESVRDLLQVADQQLYAAKRGGRNRTCMFGTEAGGPEAMEAAA